MKSMRKFTTILAIFLGIFLGILGAELGLRAFLGSNFFDGGNGYRTQVESKLPTPLFWANLKHATADGWVVLGGQIAAGVGVTPTQWFGHTYGQMAGLRFYNAAFVGGSNYLKAVKMVLSDVKVRKAALVVDMGLAANTLLAQENTLVQKPTAKLWQNLALLKVLQPQRIVPYTQKQAGSIAQNITEALMPYADNEESAIALLVPARGYWAEETHHIHKKNQESLSLALRQISKVYVVDVAYMMRDYANPRMLYNEDGTLNAKGHAALAEGLRRQMMVFSEWKTRAERTPEERLKLDQDLKKHYEKEAKRRVKLPF